MKTEMFSLTMASPDLKALAEIWELARDNKAISCHFNQSKVVKVNGNVGRPRRTLFPGDTLVIGVNPEVEVGGPIQLPVYRVVDRIMAGGPMTRRKLTAEAVKQCKKLNRAQVGNSIGWLLRKGALRSRLQD